MSKKIFPIAWLFLLFSVLGEVTGTSIMKISHSWQIPYGSEIGLIIMWCCLAFSYFCLAKATLKIPVGVAFALWDAFGLILIVAFATIVLREPLGIYKAVGLLCVLTGGALVHHGTSHSKEDK